MSNKIKSVALIDEVNDVIRERIFRKELAPGAWIDEQVLASEFGISRTPLREALRVLHGEGLVKLVPRRGCFVAQLTESDLDEIYAVLAVLEGRCAGAVAASATDAALKRLQKLHERMEQAAAERDLKRYLEANVVLHEAVQELAGNAWQKSIIKYLRGMCRLAPHVSLAVNDRLEKSIAEHRELLAALESHDPARADSVMQAHVMGTREALRDDSRTALN